MKRSISHPGTYNYERYTMFTQHTDFLFSVQTAYAVIFRVAINAGAVFLQGRACQKSAWRYRSPPRGGRGHAPIQRLTATEGPRRRSVSLAHTIVPTHKSDSRPESKFCCLGSHSILNEYLLSWP